MNLPFTSNGSIPPLPACSRLIRHVKRSKLKPRVFHRSCCLHPVNKYVSSVLKRDKLLVRARTAHVFTWLMNASQWWSRSEVRAGGSFMRMTAAHALPVSTVQRLTYTCGTKKSCCCERWRRFNVCGMRREPSCSWHSPTLRFSKFCNFGFVTISIS